MSDQTRKLFNAKVEKTSTCWNWTGAKNSHGYGNFQSRPAHRVSYEYERGVIPEGLHLDHLCRNRACVNPDHLEPVTCRENLARGERGGSPNYGENNGRAVLTGEDVLAIRRLCELGYTYTLVSDLFGVDQSTIGHVATRYRWVDVESHEVCEFLLAESRWEAGYVRGMLAEATRHDRQPDLDGLEDAQALHQFPWEAHSE